MINHSIIFQYFSANSKTIIQYEGICNYPTDNLYFVIIPIKILKLLIFFIKTFSSGISESHQPHPHAHSQEKKTIRRWKSTCQYKVRRKESSPFASQRREFQIPGSASLGGKLQSRFRRGKIFFKIQNIIKFLHKITIL